MNINYLELLESKFGIEVKEEEVRENGYAIRLKDGKLCVISSASRSFETTIFYVAGSLNMYKKEDLKGIKITDSRRVMNDKIPMEVLFLMNNLLNDYDESALEKVRALEVSTKLYDTFIRVALRKQYEELAGMRYILNNEFEYIIMNRYYNDVSDREDYNSLLELLKSVNYRNPMTGWSVNGGYGNEYINYGQVLTFMSSILQQNYFAIDNVHSNFYKLSDYVLFDDYQSIKLVGDIKEIGRSIVIASDSRLVSREFYLTLEVCNRCGNAVSNLIEHEGTQYCEHCYNNNFFECKDCGEISKYTDVRDLVNIVEDLGIETWHTCRHCLSKHIVVDCPFEGIERSCFDCPNFKTCRPLIQSWDYKPNATFYGDVHNELTFGVEIEIDKGGEDYQNFIDIRGTNKEIYAKRDGSIDEGFELVSEPMTYDHLKSMEWGNIFDRASRLGYRSHDTDTCGLHVHVGRDKLEGERHISRIIKVVYEVWDDFARFSRRNINRLDEWSKKPKYSSSDSHSANYDKNNYDRYVAVNLTNSPTIEFRMFRGTLKSDTFLATIQLLNNLIAITRGEGKTPTSFDEIVNFKNYDELDRYMLYLDDRDVKRAERAKKRADSVARFYTAANDTDGMSDYVDYARLADAHANMLSASGAPTRPSANSLEEFARSAGISVSVDDEPVDDDMELVRAWTIPVTEFDF